MHINDICKVQKGDKITIDSKKLYWCNLYYGKDYYGLHTNHKPGQYNEFLH